MTSFIKSLQWTEVKGDWKAETPFGEYWVVNTFNGWACWVPKVGNRIQLPERKWATADHARRRCQDDYDARVRGLLVESDLFTLKPLMWAPDPFGSADCLVASAPYGTYKVYPLNSQEWIGTFLGKCYEIPDSTTRVPFRAAALGFCQEHYKKAAGKYLHPIVSERMNSDTETIEADG